ncbi:MAG: hypothetical protein K0U93_05090 [Gammaproteobacteria bacterium]|nr:hypothetical protein [Gammaproteobacteria bacterium]
MTLRFNDARIAPGWRGASAKWLIEPGTLVPMLDATVRPVDVESRPDFNKAVYPPMAV